jgi:hypothetical protein
MKGCLNLNSLGLGGGALYHLPFDDCESIQGIMADNMMWLRIGIIINLSHTKNPHQSQHHKSPCLQFHLCPPCLCYSYFYQCPFDVAQTYAFVPTIAWATFCAAIPLDAIYCPFFMFIFLWFTSGSSRLLLLFVLELCMLREQSSKLTV